MIRVDGEKGVMSAFCGAVAEIMSPTSVYRVCWGEHYTNFTDSVK